MSKTRETQPPDGAAENRFRESPLEQVRTLFVGFIQGLFRAAPPGAYHWEPHEDASEILVSDESPIHTEWMGQRPAVTCTRGPVQFFSLGMDDALDHNFQTGGKTKGVLVPGTMSINCMSRAPLESERIAWIIAEQLWANRELLMARGFFEVGRMPVIGAPSPAGSLVAGDMADEYFVTTVQCPFQFYRTTQITPLGKKIVNNLELGIRARFPSANHKGPATGVAINGCHPSRFASATDAHGETPDAVERPSSPHLVPHPLNPAQRVVVRAIHPFQPGVRPPSIGGRVIPLLEPCVPESTEHVTDESKVKV